MTDWSNTGGFTSNNIYYTPMPCACGYQGSGTADFYAALGAGRGTLFWVSNTCATNLNAVDPVLELTSENIGWNLINGGPPAKSIDYGQGYNVPVPTTMPSPCYAGVQCTPTPKNPAGHY